MTKKIIGAIQYTLFICVFIFIALEIILRFYNPFQTRLKGDKIILPINQKIRFENEKISRLDKEIVHTKNSLGFRGEEKPNDFNKYLSVVAIGGSTTECYYLSDGKDWVTHVNANLKTDFNPFWINNAGLNGHSTFGHQMLLEDFIVPLKPKVALFLVGINDLGRANMDNNSMVSHEQKTAVGSDYNVGDSWIKDTFRNLIKKSEVINLIYVLERGIATQKQNFRDDVQMNITPKDTVSISQDSIKFAISTCKVGIDLYSERLKKLVNTCKKANIEPILITQPLLLGFGQDSIIHINLAKARNAQNGNGDLYWQKLQAYNDITRQVTKDSQIHLIDLANILPKNSLYFYDEMHYTNEGANKIGQIVSTDLRKYLREKYPQYLKK
jgi:lysophospholipase L1-like esterase